MSSGSTPPHRSYRHQDARHGRHRPAPKIKADSPDTEVIMLTGHGDMDLAIKCLKLEATDFITKPINDDVLEIALKRANDRISMRSAAAGLYGKPENLVREQTARLMKTERLAAVGQAVEGLSSALRGIAGDLDAGVNCFNELPCFVAIHNRRLEIIAINPLYRKRLGDHVGQPTGTALSPGQPGSFAGRRDRCHRHGRPPPGHRGLCRRHPGAGDGAHGPHPRQPRRCGTGGRNRGRHRRGEAAPGAAPGHPAALSAAFRRSPLLHYRAGPRPDHPGGQPSLSGGFRSDHRRILPPDIQKPGRRPARLPGAKTFVDGQSHQCEMEVTSKRGETYRVLIQTAPIRDLAGDITHVMEMSTNITRTRRLEDQLASLGLMIGSVSHGIKGLLTGLDGGMYLLDSGFKKGESAADPRRLGHRSLYGQPHPGHGAGHPLLCQGKGPEVGNGWTSSVLPRRSCAPWNPS
jgi:CheY-like chemotaxis protein